MKISFQKEKIFLDALLKNLNFDPKNGQTALGDTYRWKAEILRCSKLSLFISNDPDRTEPEAAEKWPFLALNFTSMSYFWAKM